MHSVLEKQFKELSDKFEQTVAAFQRSTSSPQGAPAAPPPPPGGARPGGSRLPKPDPTFQGCWHCGKRHPGGRRQCTEFKALLRKNGGKLPADYEGAYEKHLRLKGLSGKVNMLHFASLDAKAAIAEIEA